VKVVDEDTDTSITQVNVINPKEGTDKLKTIEEELENTSNNIWRELNDHYGRR
jgi:hypothetical protein